MSETAQIDSKLERSAPARPDLMTVLSGWAAIVLGILGIHRLVATGLDNWSRSGLILALGLGIMWVSGCWGQIRVRLRAWVRGGGLNSTVIAVALVASLVVVNAVVRRRVVVKYDLTKNQRFTLAPRSREILKSLRGKVEATVFVPAGRSRTTAQARDLFRQYGDASPNFSWRHVDPLVDQKTLLEKQPRLNQTDFSGAILEFGGKKEHVTEFSEKTVTGAILKLTREQKRKILFLTGHGEPDISGSSGNPSDRVQSVLEDLRSLDWTIDPVDLYAKDAAAPDPKEVALLVIAAPKRELTDPEAKRVNEYLNQGGKVLLLLDIEGPAYSSFLKDWGIKTENNLVIGQNEGGLLALTAGSSSHEAVKKIVNRRVVLEPTRSVTTLSPAPTGITVSEILSSGPGSEVIPNFVPGKPVDLSTSRPGPVGLAAMAEKTIGSGDEEKKARLVVVGSASWFTDKWMQIPFFSNLDLASGLVNYLGEEEALVAIPPKDENTEQVFLTPEQGRLLLLFHFWDFPLLALILAIFVYVKRR